MSELIHQREASTGEILAKLQEHVILVALHIGWPKMSPHIADSSVVITESLGVKHVKETLRSSPRWRLIPDEWKERLQGLEGRARKCVNNYARQFTSKGLNLLPISRADEVFRQLHVLKEEFERIAEQFCDNYSDILRDVRTQLVAEVGPAATDKAMEQLPSVSKIKDCFYLQWYSLPLASSVSEEKIKKIQQQVQDLMNHPDTGTGLMWDLGQIRNSVEELSKINAGELDASQTSELVQEAKAALRDQIQHVITDLVEGPRTEVANEMQKLVERLQSPDCRLQVDSFNALKKAIQHLKDFEFLETPKLEQALLAVNEQIAQVDARKLNESRDLGLQFANALTANIQQIADGRDMQQAVQRFRRRIHVHEPEATGAA